MSLVTYADRKGTDSTKWDGQTSHYGQEGLLPLWVADMDFKAPECVTDALKEYVQSGVYGYYTVPDSYHQAFIHWEKTHHNYEAKHEWLRFSPGVVAGFHWILQFMTAPKDSVIVLTPVYHPFMQAIENNHRQLIMCDLKNIDGKYTIDFEKFEKEIIEHKVSLFILCSPHNPVGRVWKKEELEQLLQICRKHHVFVISDEIHHDITFQGHDHIPTLSVGDYDDMVITLTAPSKTFNLAGCQNSIIIIPDERLRQKWDIYTTQIRVTSGNTFGYIAARAAYEQGGPWLNEVKEIIYQNYSYLKEQFEKELPKVIVSPLEGTYLAWFDLNHYLSKKDIIPFMQDKCNLALDYGDWFGGDRFGTMIRLNLATSKDNVATAVHSIIQNLKSYQ